MSNYRIEGVKRREVYSPCVGSRHWRFGRITILAAYQVTAVEYLPTGETP